MKYIDDIYTDKIYHWVMFLKHSNLGFLQKQSITKTPKKVKKDNSVEALNAYHEINDQLLNEFGVDEKYLQELETQKEIALDKLSFIIDNDKSKRTEWKIKEAQLPEKEEKTKEYDFSKELGIISQSLGGQILDIKTTTIHQYYTAKHLLKEKANG